jgi:hypothetical protein
MQYAVGLAGDSNRLKQLTVCNFDFLLAAVQTISVSYLRCVLEHVRCFLLDRDLELVYYTIRKSSDVLTRDPLQLGAQVICWLRPVAGLYITMVPRDLMIASQSFLVFDSDAVAEVNFSDLQELKPILCETINLEDIYGVSAVLRMDHHIFNIQLNLFCFRNLCLVIQPPVTEQVNN